jgi:hypothetical protein
MEDKKRSTLNAQRSMKTRIILQGGGGVTPPVAQAQACVFCRDRRKTVLDS